MHFLPSHIDWAHYQQLLFENPLINVPLLVACIWLFLPVISVLLPADTTAIETPPSVIPTTHEKGYTWMPSSFPPTTVWQNYNPYDLRRFDGTDGGRILFAIKGKVYDVSNGRNFYGPDGPYGNFAGRDASRGLAKQSFDADMLTPVDAPIDDLADLTPGERENLREWQAHFQAKYTICGDFVPAH